MTSGTVTTGSIVAGGTSTQTFSGTSGDGIKITATASYNTFLIVKNPDGTTLASNPNGLSATLPSTGTYSVVISGQNATDAGSYNLYYVEGGKGVSNGSLTSGATATFTLPVNGLISYQFTGTAGQAVKLSLAGSTYHGNIILYKPDGSYFDGNPNSISETLPSTGTYTVVLQGQNYSDSGSANLYYVRGSSSVSNGSLTSGATATFTLPVNGLISYQFTGTAGQEVKLSLAGSTYYGNIILYKPDGSYFDGNPNSIGETLPVTGTYTVVLQGQNYSDSGPSNLYYVRASSSVSNGSLVNGSIVLGNLPLNGLVSYQLAGTAGQPILLKVTASYSPIISIYYPDGSAFDGGINTVSDTLPNTGTYTVIIRGQNYSDTGAYNIYLTGPISSASASDGAYCLDGCKGGAAAGDPINVATGNLYETVKDYTTAGANPLALIRSYNSMTVSRGLFSTMMGVNWRTNYDRYLNIISSTSAAAQRADGQAVIFYLIGGVWKPDADKDYTLTNSGTTWTLTDPDDTVETYTGSSGRALVNTIKLRNGYTQTMNYTSGVLTSVSDSYNRSLGFTYTNGVLTGLTTPDNLTLTYGYTTVSSQPLLTSVGYNTVPATSMTYLYENASFPYALTGITDENGHRYATWTYDASGRAKSSQLGGPLAANLTQISYDDATGNRTVTGPLGIQETYKFATMQNVPKVTEINRAANGTVASATEKFQYDTNGYLKSLTDWNGNNTWYVNNSYGLPTSIVFASGSPVAHTTSVAYDTTWARLAKTITTPGLTTTNNYEVATGNLLTRVLADTTTQTIPYSTQGQTRTWTYTYTPTGQLKTIQLPRTDVVAKTTFGYGAASPNLGTMVSVTDALNHVTTVNTYKPGGLPLTVTDPNGIQSTLGYAPRLWLTSSTLATGSLATTLQYDAAGEVIKATLPDGSYLSYGYDNARRRTSVTNRLSETQGISYNSAGGLTQTLWKTAAAVTKRQHTATFDALNRLRTDVGGMGQTTTFTYDNNGNVTTIQDPLLHNTVQTFDQLNRLKTATNAVKDLVQYTYDAHDRPLTVKDGKTNTTTYVYDGFGEVIQETSPDRGTTVTWYDKDGNVGKVSGFAIANYTYDALDRLLTRTYPADATLNATLTYDQTGHGSGVGRLTSVTDQAGTLSLSYDQRGLATSNARTISGTAYTTGYTYESAGRLASVTYPTAGWKVIYARDLAGQVSAVTAKPPSASAVNLATSITHYPFGPVNTFTYGNGLTSTRTYDLDYRMTSVADTTPTVNSLAYTYDADNNVKTITDAVTPANNQTVNYDAIDRLSSATGSYGSTGSITYDSNSNRKAYGTTAYTVPTTSNKVSAIGATAISYSSTGNVTAIGTGNTFTWNKANQMATAVATTTTSTYGYDFLGQRLKVTVGANPLQVMNYDQNGNQLTETNNGTETDYAYLDPGSESGAGSLPIYAIQPATSVLSAIHTDKLGTPQKATNASKAIVFTGNYDPNGKTTPTTTITQNLRFPGQYNDATGFYHNGFRDYAPDYAKLGGRYLEVDPMGLNGGINPYVYGENNTYKNIDPSGLDVVYLNDPKVVPLGIVNAGHSAFLVGNDNTGWTYYSKNGGNSNTREYYSSLDAFFQSNNASRYDNAALLTTQFYQDVQIEGYADQDYQRRYNRFTNNCGDLINGSFNAGDITIPSQNRILPTIPYSQYQGILTLQTGRSLPGQKILYPRSIAP